MNYSFYLFTKLFNTVINIEYEYDLMFNDLSEWFNKYESSIYNDENKTEYECILDFLNNNKEQIIKSYE